MKATPIVAGPTPAPEHAASGGKQRHGRSAAVPLFQTGQDTAHLVGDVNRPAALIFNPEADLEMLLAALVGRTKALKEWLFTFAVGQDHEEVSLRCVASNMHPLAEEVEIMVAEINRRVGKGGAA